MKISAVLCVYNGEHTIRKAIDSIFQQTVPVAEVVLIDDGSTDHTAQIVRKYGAKIRYFYYENAGLAVARNRGIEKAKSEWIAFLDADDEWLPQKIESQVRVLERNPEIKWSSCHHVNVSVVDGAHTSTSIPANLQEQIRRTGTVSFFDAQMSGLFGTPSGMIVHRSVLDEVGTFDPAMRTGQDGDMWCRIALKYPRIAICPEVGFKYYVGNPNALSRKGRRHRDLQLKSLCKNMRRAMELGTKVVNEFYPYARMKVIDYLIREAGRECTISPNTIEDAKDLFPPSVRERVLLRVLSSLPRPIALKVVGKLSS